MKTQKRFLGSVLCFLMVVFCVVGLTACLGGNSCSHSWGEWSVKTHATCTAEGMKERKCLKCGKTETSAVAALGHDWNAATCSEPKTCKTCSATNGSALGHIPNEDDGDCTTDILCSVCNAVTTPANATHAGGQATCTNKAQCEVCGTEYGDLAAHTPNEDDGDCTTDILCSVCNAVTTPANATHTGGQATCTNKAQCEICGTEYGDLAAHIPNEDDGDCTTDILCSVCGVVTTTGNATHTGGEATCTNKAQCNICGTEYGELAEHTPNADDGDCTTDILCSACGVVTTPGNAIHTGGEATCTNKAQCDICGTEYGELAEHTPNADDGDCTTDILCSVCGVVTTPGNATHTGGEATCANKAQCDICGTEYGELAEHTPNADDGDCTTDILCSACGVVTTPGNATHTGGEATCVSKAKCDICGTEYGELASHVGGEATCTNKAICDVCGTEYGELAAHIPNEDDGDCTTDILCSVCGEVAVPADESHKGGEATCENKAVCEVCGAEYGELAEHVGGEATCTNKAQCEVCGEKYGAFAAHIPNDDDGDCTTEVLCSVCGAVAIPANATHAGGEATCTSKAQCEICGTEYGELAAHIPNEDDGDCTTDILCSVCGVVTTTGNATHTGGEATCANKAQCEVCGIEYGELAEHIPNADDGDCTTDILCSTCGAVAIPGNAEHEEELVWMKHLDSHYLVYSCCSVRASEPEGHTIVGGICTECGFNPTITLSSVEAASGETQVSIAISITDNPGITGMTITVQYSSEFLTLTGAENGDALDALTFTEPSNLNSGCTFMWDALEIQDKDIKNGEILILMFDVSSSAPEGTYSILLNVSAYDNDLKPISLTITGGKVLVENN